MRSGWLWLCRYGGVLMTHELRSGEPLDGTLDLFPDLPAPAQAGGGPRGVGGRQAGRRARRGGGGYLNGCNVQKVAPDLRLRELHEIGLAAVWLSVAELLGYDQFIALWRLLSSTPGLVNEYNQIKLSLRTIRSWDRYQRNRYIATLAASGIKASEIHAVLRRELGESPNPRQVSRIVFETRGRDKAQPATANGIDE